MAGSETRTRTIRRVLAGILVANILVLLTKAVVSIRSGSLAVLGDTIHSFIDAGNNIIALAVVRVAGKAPDDDHPYGHGKFETLGALVVVVFLSASILELIRGAISRLITGGTPVAPTTTDLALMGATLVVNLWVVWYETGAGHRLQSEILLADAAHTRADVIITVAVIGGLILTRAGYPWADPVLALVVSAMVIRIGVGIVRRSIPSLVDEAVVGREAVRRAAMQISGVRSVSDIRSRRAAEQRFAELTIGVDGHEDVATAHRIADAVEARLHRDFSLDHIVVHVEPC
ncbi:MAG: cation diffusion facilitator family transporter [Gemmatimonadales bacterium]